MPGETTLRRDVVVIGAGWTGLISAKTYLDLAPETDLLILDNKRTIGGVWAKEQLYPGLFAQVSWPLFEYSFYPMPKVDISKDGYVPGSTIHKYLNDFAQDFDLVKRIRLETIVEKVDRTSCGGWMLSCRDQPDVICDKIIWAVGPAASPIAPKWINTGFTGPVLHSQCIQEIQAKLDGVDRVTVVGAAKSGLDTVYLLVKAGKKVDWIIRPDGAGTLSMAVPRLFGIWNIVDVISTRAWATLSPSIMQTSGFWYNTLQRTTIGRAFATTMAYVATFLSDREAGYGQDENWEKLRPTPHGTSIFWARAGLGTASAPDFWKTLHAGDLTVHRDEIESLSHVNVVNLKGGLSIESDMVIGCIGYEKPFRPFSRELREELGLEYAESEAVKWEKLDAQADAVVVEKLPRLAEGPALQPLALSIDKPSSRGQLQGPGRQYRRMVPLKEDALGKRTIVFPGLVHVIFTPTVSEMQALWGAAYLLNRLPVPSASEMEVEVATFNAWVRRRYLEAGRKHAYCIYDYLSYLDTLARDLGIKTNRKGNPFTEMFIRYKPSDYRGMVSEYRIAEARKILSPA